ncbi:3-deoxy-D-manno-octulosonate cytidylyltransferase [Candidatus Nitrosoglobus terrae]|uniref:3-deoxy-manno-octulosonate cytidylyltransferase n=1 Tax=Candidatus Nitrosoglobus terrae TaxID=1630141 RepID=A0A1Q2SKH8_9GAMM|nr:3-deoxy-manno-octulosonate cytidylyltransferase [Candidatus Nitrosoglobus terrae]BAW79617.1 3-deoxy-D-manno-octulosonate cytidylyltransferase [Candidatus Nitrosoglobus terrae]
MAYKVIIPARYNSSRLPGKPLLDLAGKPMLAHVIAKAQVSGAEEILVATDDSRIQAAAKNFGIEACMTSIEHTSGTDRIAEVISQRGYPDQTIIVNVQGDEPLLPAQLIAQVAADLAAHPKADAATLRVPISNQEELFNPNIVKVVCNAAGYALYFSRAPIPWDRENFTSENDSPTKSILWPCYRHIGLYAYRAQFLRHYSTLSICKLEQTEQLEQLRILYHGGYIHVAIAQEIPIPGIDTPTDLERVRNILVQNRKA